MRSNPVLFFLLFAGILTIIDLYVFKGIRLLTQELSPVWIKRVIHTCYWVISISLITGIALMIWKPSSFFDFRNYFFSFHLFGLLILFLVPKLIFLIFHGLEDITHLVRIAIANLSGPSDSGLSAGSKITRADFLTKAGLIASAIPFTTIAYGIMKGRFAFRVLREELAFKNLPSQFDGLKVAQISDMHIGSFFNYYSSVEKGIKMVNDLNPDIILFTGDMVNNYASETDGWKPVLSKLKAPMGKFSILGNHDYGEYVDWSSDLERYKNFDNLKKFHKEIGFDLLLNENRKLKKGGEEIALVGVENWGRKPFPQYGDLRRSFQGTEKMPFRILMTHDPSHWEEEVLGKEPVDLTLSGHTHGMQFGVEIGGIKWSPVKMRYPRWGGLYKEGKQYLYVNRGFGYIGFPGRIGMPPEITLITLRKG